MREIEFRGKRVETGEWLYGSVLNKIYGSKPVIVICSVLNDSCELNIDYYHAEPETIGQFTGLLDTNGQRIFEGDIVSWPKEDGYGHVYWAKDEARFVIEFEGCIVDFDNLWGHELEVYSNIHDNPELLLEGEE